MGELADYRVIKGSPGQILNGKGELLACVSNGAFLLAGDRDWKGVIGFNELRRRVTARRRLPGYESIVGDAADEWVERDWRDEDTLAATQWLEQKTAKKWGSALVADVINAVAFRPANKYHPIQEYFSELPLEHKDSPADTWLIDYLGAEDNDYSRQVGRWWLISAVARVLRPGCKVDSMVVLEGGQGTFKSTALRMLCPDAGWFCDSRMDLNSKEAYQQLEGVWIYEVAELDSFRGRAETQIKGFLTSQVDSYRPPYGKHKQDFPRQCVFAGTTNEESWIEDRTGGRRFWPVRCGVTQKVDYEGLANARDNLWTHARNLFTSGDPWWATDDKGADDCATAQESRQTEDTWSDAIAKWYLDGHRGEDANGISFEVSKPNITTGAILQFACGVPTDRHDQRSIRRVSAILRHMGWVQERVMVDGRRFRKWTPPSDLEDQETFEI